MPTETDEIIFKTQLSDQGLRLDHFLAQKIKQTSRANIQKWIKSNRIKINDTVINKCNTLLLEHMVIKVQEPERQALTHQEEAMSLHIVYEDDDLLIINKPAGLVVHPGAGQPNQTLMNGLLHHHKNAKNLPRAGIIHRLDKQTSGLLIAAKHEVSHLTLIDQMANRQIHRQYQAVVMGHPKNLTSINKPIGRHQQVRVKMSINKHGKPAITHVLDQKNHGHYASELTLKLETGRTHQIRVHMQSIKHPIINDEVYGQKKPPSHWPEPLKKAWLALKQHTLHAKKLEFNHPINKEKKISVKAPTPKNMLAFIEQLTLIDKIGEE